jgi:hypothetical protein
MENLKKNTVALQTFTDFSFLDPSLDPDPLIECRYVFFIQCPDPEPQQWLGLITTLDFCKEHLN